MAESGKEKGIAPASSEAREETHEMLRSLSAEERERLTVLQQLLATADQPHYVKRQQAAAQKLGISERSVRRLLRQLREEGVAQVVRRGRSECPQGARCANEARHESTKTGKSLLCKPIRKGIEAVGR